MLAAVDEKSIEAAFKNIQMNEKFVGLKYAAEARTSLGRLQISSRRKVTRELYQLGECKRLL